MPKTLNPKIEAEEILVLHTKDFLTAISIPKDDIVEMPTREMLDIVVDGCANILTERLVNGRYSLREYYLVRSCLADLINEIDRREPTTEEG